MARVTIEDCLEQVPNRFVLIHMAFQRVNQLRAGAAPTIQSKNKEVVVALREIAAGSLSFPLDRESKVNREEISSESEKNSGGELLPET